MAYPEVKFVVRYPAGQGAWRYEALEIPNPGGSYFMPLEHLPAEGDLVSLWASPMRPAGPFIPGGPFFRVVRRYWTWSGYGSVNWPYGAREAQSGPSVEIFVEPAAGPYSDEAPICAVSDCTAMWIDRAWVIRDPADQEAVEDHEHQIYVSDPTKR
jgi:hypothetical protein